MAFTIGSGTFTNGSATVTGVTLTSGTLAYFASGTRMVVGVNPVIQEVEAIAAPTVSTITLRSAWTGTGGTYSFLANQTSEGLRDAVQAIRTNNASLQSFIDSIDTAATADSVAQRTSDGSINAVNVYASGNVGIGTASPSALGKVINVEGGGGGASLALDGGDNFGVIYTGPTADDPTALISNTGFKFATATAKDATGFSEKVRIDSSGNVALTGNEQEFLFHSNYSIGNTDRAKIKVIGAGGGSGYGGDLTFHTKNPSNAYSERMRIDSSGNVGIGTSSPAEKLEVAVASAGGDMRVVSGGTVSAKVGASASAGGVFYGSATNHPAILQTNNTERMRIDSSGNVLIGTTNGFGARLYVRSASTTAGNFITGFGSGTAFSSLDLYVCDAAGSNTAASAARMEKNSATGRSLNAAGTVNASGADYAEYMTKCGDFEIAKGDIVGINSDGKLTNVFADAVSFCVKSTDPSYVGGDVWGSEDAVGSKPQAPTQQVAEFDEEGNETQSAETDEAFAKRQAQYKADLADFESRLEAARQKVDRIAFAGQVPVNVLGAVAGQYIVPTDEGGAIKGIAKDESEMTLGDYMRSVGKVITVKEDGRAFIIVKVA